MEKLNDLAGLKDLAKKMKKEEKTEKKAAAAVRPLARPVRHNVAPDGSNATIEDYLCGGDVFLDDKYGGTAPVRHNGGNVPQSASKYLTYDLHINALEHPKSLPREKYLEWQFEAFRKIMENNEAHLGRKIVFIHGQGDGVLRKALTTELDERWWTCEYAPAPEEQYGFGAAIVVTIK